MATVPGAEDDEDAPGRDQMMSLGVQQLANSLAASGGIGIGKMIAKALHKAAEQPATPTATPTATPATVPTAGPAEAKKIEK
jgi:Rod binding domain-containing protein